jgi:hypothetical protein
MQDRDGTVKASFPACRPYFIMPEVDESDDSDEWGMEELDIKDVKVSPNAAETACNDDNDEAHWTIELKKDEPKLEQTKKKVDTSSEPMIIVDITQMDPNIHSKHDRNSVNDPAAASAIRKTIELDYQTFSKDVTRISDGTVLPCASSVWRDALVRLRDDRPGHYFLPIFPPKKS